MAFKSLNIGLKIKEEMAKRKDSFVSVYETSKTTKEIATKSRPILEDLGKVVTLEVLKELHSEYGSNVELSDIMAEIEKI